MFKVERVGYWNWIKTECGVYRGIAFLDKDKAREYATTRNNLVLASNAIGYCSK